MREARLGREKNETNLASTGASANPVGSPGVGTGLQRCFKLGQEVGSLYSYTWPVTTCGLPMGALLGKAASFNLGQFLVGSGDGNLVWEWKWEDKSQMWGGGAICEPSSANNILPAAKEISALVLKGIPEVQHNNHYIPQRWSLSLCFLTLAQPCDLSWPVEWGRNECQFQAQALRDLVYFQFPS